MTATIKPLRPSDAASYHEDLSDESVEAAIAEFREKVAEWKRDGFEIKSLALLVDAHKGERYRLARFIKEQRLSETVSLLEMTKYEIMRDIFGK